MSPAEPGSWPSDEWVDEMAGSAGSRPPAPGCSGTVSLMIGTGKRGSRDVHYHWSYTEGVPGGGGVGPLPDADLTLTITPADAVEVASGSMSPSVAFMRGRLKATGDGSLLLGLLESTAGVDYARWRGTVATGLLDGAPEVRRRAGAPRSAGAPTLDD